MGSFYTPVMVIVVLVGLLPLALWVMYRAERIYKLRKELIDLCADFNRRNISWLLMKPKDRFNVRAIYEYSEENIAGFMTMLFSFRPLILEEWLPEHLLDLLQTSPKNSSKT